MSNHILLISYTFPPYPGIGGRRWAKFAKYLAKSGYTVHVIQAPGPYAERSLWTDDVEHDEHINRYEVSSRYPIILTSNPKSFLQKINYRLSLLLVNLLTKGTPYDKGVFWKKSMLEKSKALIKQFNIRNVIVSCAPFSSGYYSLELKEQFKDLNLIVDFRDPWTWGVGYGFNTLSNKRMFFEAQKEKNVIETVDCVLVPSNEMKKHLDSNYKLLMSNVHVLSHGFDEDEVCFKSKNKSSNLKLLFYGSLYNNLDGIFKEVIQELKNHQKEVKLDIYASAVPNAGVLQTSKNGNLEINIYQELSPKILFEKVNECDYILIIQPDYAKDFITTKIFEIIYSGTPIILVSKKGKLSEFIHHYKLGLWIDSSNLKHEFKKIENIDMENFELKMFPIKNYSYNILTSNLISFFK